MSDQTTAPDVMAVNLLQRERIAQLEAAWERDQSVIEEQRQEIGKLKSQINQLLQERRALRDRIKHETE